MSIPLPPLPSALLISTEHGPFRDSMHEESETYCVRCKTRSIFSHTRKCDPHVNDDQLRARDQEIVRCVLKAAAKTTEGHWDGRQEKLWAEICADAIRALEFHHE